MSRFPRRQKQGFSLIELLIVVAIIAALVGVAVPMFQKNIQEANVAKARQDLDTIRQAVSLHDSQERPLIGTDLKPLLGRYLQEIPSDPWGNEYLLDANVGVIISFGGDQRAGGATEEDQDIEVNYKPALKIQRVTYTGSWGVPRSPAGTPPPPPAEMRISWSKPFAVTNGGNDVPASIVLILDPKAPGTTIPMAGGAVTGTNTSYGTTWGGKTWSYNATKSDPANAVMVLTMAEPSGYTPGQDHVRITSSMALNLTGTTPAVRELLTTGGPLDSNIYGDQVKVPSDAVPIELVGGENRGVPIERSR